MNKLFFIVSFLISAQLLAQQQTTNDTISTSKIKLEKQALDPLAPSKAAFYSAILPGLGQAYNKKYWKIPVVYAAMGTSIYFYISNQQNYNKFRNEYKKRLLGIHDKSDPLFGRLDNARLINAQKRYQSNRDLAMVITVGLYILNIVDANVDAHLQQFNVDDDLAISPTLNVEPLNYQIQPGVLFTYKF